MKNELHFRGAHGTGYIYSCAQSVSMRSTTTTPAGTLADRTTDKTTQEPQPRGADPELLAYVSDAVDRVLLRLELRTEQSNTRQL